MQLAERQQAFEAAVKARYGTPPQTDVRESYGFSNSTKVIERGIFVGLSNLNTWTSSRAKAFVLQCVIRFPPEDEVYFAVVVSSGLATMAERLEAMIRLAEGTAGNGDGDEDEQIGVFAEAASMVTANNSNHKNVRFYLAQDGHLYLRNKGYWDSLDFDLSLVGPGIEIDEIGVAIYPPGASAQRSTLAREFVGYLGKFIGRDKIHELAAWSVASSVGDQMRRMPAELDVADIRRAIEALDGHYVDDLVERYHESLNYLAHKHFVILSGLSGTGKTQLGIQYARAVHGITNMADDDPLLKICTVRPEWTDPSGLIGYHDMLTNKYVVPPFLEAVLLAEAHDHSPVFVILDEMNLARVEHYFADVLSAMETRGRIQLHSSGVPIEGSTGGEVRAEIAFPSNLYIVGTVNVDETTNTISDKVLDRAVVIDMSKVELTSFFAKLAARDGDLASSVAAVGGLLADLNGELLPHNCGFGYRVAEEIVRYHAFAAVKLGRASSDVIDDMLAQKVLVKLKGSHAQRQMLVNLGKLLAGYPRSQAIVQRLADDLDDLGSFRYGR